MFDCLMIGLRPNECFFVQMTNILQAISPRVKNTCNLNLAIYYSTRFDQMNKYIEGRQIENTVFWLRLKSIEADSL